MQIIIKKVPLSQVARDGGLPYGYMDGLEINGGAKKQGVWLVGSCSDQSSGSFSRRTSTRAAPSGFNSLMAPPSVLPLPLAGCVYGNLTGARRRATTTQATLRLCMKSVFAAVSDWAWRLFKHGPHVWHAQQKKNPDVSPSPLCLPLLSSECAAKHLTSF